MREVFVVVRRLKCAWILPGIALVLTGALAVVGEVQTKRRFAEHQEVWGWDYLAPAEAVLHSINYPAAVGAGLTTGNYNFRIGLEYSGVTFLVYAIGVALQWYVVGRCVDVRRRTMQPWSHAVIPTLALLYGALLLFVAVGVMQGPYAVVLMFSAFLWSVAVILLAARFLFRRILSDRGTEPPTG